MKAVTINECRKDISFLGELLKPGTEVDKKNWPHLLSRMTESANTLVAKCGQKFFIP